jgi:hypothetical protein
MAALTVADEAVPGLLEAKGKLGQNGNAKCVLKLDLIGPIGQYKTIFAHSETT